MSSLKINTFKSNHDSFIGLLQENQIPFEIKTPKANQIMASGYLIEILNITPELIQSIIDALTAWLTYKAAKLGYETAKINPNKHRKIFIQKQDITIVVEGYPVEEAERLIGLAIHEAKEITLIEIDKTEQ